MGGSMDDVGYIERESEVYIPFFKRLPVLFERGDGCWLFDDKGRKYLDLVAGIACVSVGHSHPYFIEKVAEQLNRLVHVSNLFYTTPQIRLAEKLRNITSLSKFFFCNSGTEAVEGALKIARKVTGRKKFIAMENSFHGRTMGALSVTWKEKFRKPFEPLIHPVSFCRFNDIHDLEEKVDSDTAGIIIEPIQGESGVHEVSQEFVNRVFELKEVYNFVVIFDEIQTGFGRTGKWFAKEHYGKNPDIITTAKAMASGIPIGGIGVTDEVAEMVEVSEHGSTFGGNPLACSASLATIEIIERENLVENSRVMGNYFRDRLKEIGLNPRGRGLMIGFEVDDAVEFVKKCLSSGVVVNNTSERTVRLLPPLTVSKDEVDYAIEVFSKILG
jgi:acetylornithine/N-succinyldiaminopimelate aminotransferase